MREDEEFEELVPCENPCEVCGVPATKHWASYALCDNTVCFLTKVDYIRESFKELNNKAKGSMCE